MSDLTSNERLQLSEIISLIGWGKGCGYFTASETHALIRALEELKERRAADETSAELNLQFEIDDGEVLRIDENGIPTARPASAEEIELYALVGKIHGDLMWARAAAQKTTTEVPPTSKKRNLTTISERHFSYLYDEVLTDEQKSREPMKTGLPELIHLLRGHKCDLFDSATTCDQCERDAVETTADGWRPVETAPRDTVVLTLRTAPAGQLISLAKFARIGGNMAGWVSMDDASVGYFKVTHWLPIPAFPEKTNRDEADSLDENARRMP